VGVVPDGIAGIFKSKPGTEVLYIGSKRGLMRICLEEGALILGGWFAGTSDLFTIVQDPLSILEWVSRRLQVSLFLFYGRWCLPIPRRVPLTMCPRVLKSEKVDSPSEETVEQLHQNVYNGLSKDFCDLRRFSGHPQRSLQIL